jgi:hypothetical protein
MDVIQIELAKLRRDASLSQSVADVDRIIEQLERARETILESMALSWKKYYDPACSFYELWLTFPRSRSSF